MQLFRLLLPLTSYSCIQFLSLAHPALLCRSLLPGKPLVCCGNSGSRIVGCYLLGSVKSLQHGVRVAATAPVPAVLTPLLLMRNLLLVQLSSFATNKFLCLRRLKDILFDLLQVLCKSNWNISALSPGTGGSLSRSISFFNLGAPPLHSEHHRYTSFPILENRFHWNSH